MNDNDDGPIPVSEFHRGIGIHASQAAERVAAVQRAIDDVFQTSNIARLAHICRDKRSFPLEARALAYEKLLALWQTAANERMARPKGVDLAACEAAVAARLSRGWAQITREWEPTEPNDDGDAEA